MIDWKLTSEILPPKDTPVLGFRNREICVCEYWGINIKGEPYWFCAGLKGNPTHWAEINLPSNNENCEKEV